MKRPTLPCDTTATGFSCRRWLQQFWLIPLLLIASLVGSWVGHTVLSQQAHERAAQAVYQAAGELQASLPAQLEQPLHAAWNLQGFFLTQDQPPVLSTFETYARWLLTGRFPQALLLSYTSTDGQYRYRYPAAGVNLLRDYEAVLVPATLQTAHYSNAPFLSAPLSLTNGSPGVLASVPLYRDNELLGVVQCLYPLTALLPAATAQDPRVTLQIADSQGQPVWGEPPRYEPVYRRTFTLYGSTWQITAGWAQPPHEPVLAGLLLLWGGPLALVALTYVLMSRSYQRASQLQRQIEQRTAALAASESRYRALVETVPVGVFVHDGERLLYLNQTLAETLRLPSPEAGLGRSIFHFIQPDEHATARQAIQAILFEKRPQPPHREHNRRADGSEFIAEISSVPVTYEGRPAVLGILHDLTSALQTEQQLHKLNRILRAISTINQAIIRLHEPEALLEEACRILVQERHYYGVWIDRLTEPAAAPQPVAYAGRPHAPTNPAPAAPRVASSRVASSDETQPLGIFSLPIVVHGQPCFQLTASAEDPLAFDTEECTLLQELAQDLGQALERMEIEARQARYEEALRASEDRFRRLAENAPVGIVLIQDNLFRYINPTAARMFGYQEPEELLNRLGPEDLTVPEDWPVVAENIRKRITGEVRSVHYTVRAKRRDGTIFDIEIYGTRISHSGRPAIISTVMDVTEREQGRRQLEALAQAGLRLSHTRTADEVLQATVELVLTLVPGEASNIILLEADGSGQIAAHTGYTTPFLQALIAEARQQDLRERPTFQWMAATRQPLRLDQTAASPLWLATPASSPILSYLGAPLVVRDSVIGFLNVDAFQPARFSEQDAQRLKIFADYVAAMLENSRLLESLAEERNRLALLFKVSQALTETLSLPEVAQRALQIIGDTLGAARGVLYLWDEATQRIQPLAGMGLQPPALTELNRLLHTIPEGGQGLVYHVARTRQAVLAREVTRNPYWIFIPGVDDWVQTALDVPLESHGQLIGVLSLLGEQSGDFDERDLELLQALSVPIALALQNARLFAQAQQQTEEMAKALAQQQELDRLKDHIVQNVSHDFATPVTIILNHAELLHAGELGPLQPQQAHSIAVITGRIRMLNRLVKDLQILIDPNRREEQAALYTALDLSDLVRTTLLDLQPQFQEAGLTLTGQITEGLRVHGEPVNLQRVVDNLLNNARKFTPAGGQVTVTLEREEDTALLQVCDTGIGIPPDKLERVFERFYQVDRGSRFSKGLGIGLALVKSIVEAHGGQVWASSPRTADPRHPGTCLAVRLPLLTDPGAIRES